MLIIGTFDVLTKLLLFVRKFVVVVVVSIVVESIEIVVIGKISLTFIVDIVDCIVVSSLTAESSFIIGSDDRTDEDIELTAFVGLLLFIDVVVVKLFVVVVTSVVNVVVQGVIINDGEDDEIQFNDKVALHGKEIVDDDVDDNNDGEFIVVVVVNKPVGAVVDDVVFVVLLFAVVELAARSRPPVFCCCSRCNLKYLLKINFYNNNKT